jgi:ADP-heptose:LPS heptosyltransferase
MKPSEKSLTHITDFYIQQFIVQSGLFLELRPVNKAKSLIKTTKADINRGREILEEINVDFNEKLVVIQPGSGGLHKCCHLDNFLSAAKVLKSKGTEVIFLLGPAEMERLSASTISQIEAFSKTLTNLPLADVLAVLSNASGYIGNDSGITHLAAAMGVKTAAIFGPTTPAIYGPIGPAVTVVTNSDTDFAKKPSAKLQKELLSLLDANFAEK